MAKVRINKSKSCKECGKAQAGICGKSGEGMILVAGNEMHAREGDRVTLDLEKKIHIKAYFLIFILPILALFLFAYLGHEISGLIGINSMDVIFGMTGLVLTILYSLYKIRTLDNSAEMEITKIVGQSPVHENDVTTCP